MEKKVKPGLSKLEKGRSYIMKSRYTFTYMNKNLK